MMSPTLHSVISSTTRRNRKSKLRSSPSWSHERKGRERPWATECTIQSRQNAPGSDHHSIRRCLLSESFSRGASCALFTLEKSFKDSATISAPRKIALQRTSNTESTRGTAASRNRKVSIAAAFSSRDHLAKALGQGLI